MDFSVAGQQVTFRVKEAARRGGPACPPSEPAGPIGPVCASDRSCDNEDEKSLWKVLVPMIQNTR
jgi:hypothetical protein